MSDSYLYLKCAQCGIEKLLYHENTSQNYRNDEESLWKLSHYGHEAAVGIRDTSNNTYNPETEMVVKRVEISKKEEK